MSKERDHIEELFNTELSDLNVTPNDAMEEIIMDAIDFEGGSASKSWSWAKTLLVLVIAIVGVTGCVALFSNWKNIERNEKKATRSIHFTPDSENQLNKQQETKEVSDLAHISVDTAETKNYAVNPKTKDLYTENNHTQNVMLPANHANDNMVATSEFPTKNETVLLAINSDSPTTNLTVNTPSFGIESSVRFKNEITSPSFSSLSNEGLMPTFTSLKDPQTYMETECPFTPPILPHELTTINRTYTPLIDIDTLSKKGGIKFWNQIGIHASLLYPVKKQNEQTFNNGDTVTSVSRNRTYGFGLDYRLIHRSNFWVETGINHEKWTENWDKSRDTTLLVTKDTIIGGVPATIAFYKTIQKVTKANYTIRRLDFPLTLGYNLIITPRLSVGLHIGGFVSHTKLLRNISLVDNINADLNEEETSLSFSTKFGTSVNYRVGKFGIGLLTNYTQFNAGQVNLFPRTISRPQFEAGLRLFYTF